MTFDLLNERGGFAGGPRYGMMLSEAMDNKELQNSEDRKGKAEEIRGRRGFMYAIPTQALDWDGWAIPTQWLRREN